MTHSNEYCPKCGKKNDKVQVPICGIPVTSSTDGTVISGPENCPWGFPDIKPLSNIESKVLSSDEEIIDILRAFRDAMRDTTGVNYKKYLRACEIVDSHKPTPKVLPSEWISVEDKPLYTINGHGNLTCTEEGSGEFIAAVPTNTGWWVKHCLVEDYGLAVVGDSDNEPAGWGIEDVTHYIPMPEGPYKLN